MNKLKKEMRKERMVNPISYIHDENVSKKDP